MLPVCTLSQYSVSGIVEEGNLWISSQLIIINQPKTKVREKKIFSPGLSSVLVCNNHSKIFCSERTESKRRMTRSFLQPIKFDIRKRIGRPKWCQL